MSLNNLQAIGRPQALPPDAAGMAKLLLAAQQNLADAQVAQISPGNRFDAAFDILSAVNDGDSYGATHEKPHA